MSTTVTSDGPAAAPGHVPRAAAGMSRLRLWLVHAAIAVIVLGHLRSLVTDSEDWPFSRYPMYSYPPPKELVAYRVAAVAEEPGGAGERELLLTSSRYFRPLSHLAVGSTLYRLDRHKDRQKLLDAAMRDLVARYEARRLAGAHDGPPLRRLRLYKLSWSVQPDAANRGWPDRRELVHEVAGNG